MRVEAMFFASDEPVTDEEELSFGSSSISLASSSSKKLDSGDTDKLLGAGSSDLLDDEPIKGEKRIRYRKATCRRQ